MSASDHLDDRFVPVADSRPHDAPWATMVWPPQAGTVLQGHLVEVAPVDPGRDAEGLFGVLDHDDVWAHMSGRPRTGREYADALRSHLAAGRFPWLVRLRRGYAGLPAGSLVGTSAYLEVSVGDARLEVGATAYSPAVWGTSVNPDTKLLLLGYAFEHLGAGRVQLKTDVRNVRSQRAIDRLGARHEGTLRRYQRRGDGTVRDTVLFSVTAEDWPRVRDGLRARLPLP